MSQTPRASSAANRVYWTIDTLPQSLSEYSTYYFGNPQAYREFRNRVITDASRYAWRVYRDDRMCSVVRGWTQGALDMNDISTAINAGLVGLMWWVLRDGCDFAQMSTGQVYDLIVALHCIGKSHTTDANDLVKLIAFLELARDSGRSVRYEERVATRVEHRETS
jgi:hypothetical protein